MGGFDQIVRNAELPPGCGSAVLMSSTPATAYDGYLDDFLTHTTLDIFDVIKHHVADFTKLPPLLKRLRQVKRKAGLTYKQVAAGLFVGEITLMRWLCGHNVPNSAPIISRIEEFIRKYEGKTRTALDLINGPKRQRADLTQSKRLVKRLRQAMRKAGLTNTRVAAELQVHERSLSRWFRGHYVPKSAPINIRIAEFIRKLEKQ